MTVPQVEPLDSGEITYVYNKARERIDGTFDDQTAVSDIAIPLLTMPDTCLKAMAAYPPLVCCQCFAHSSSPSHLQRALGWWMHSPTLSSTRI